MERIQEARNKDNPKIGQQWTNLKQWRITSTARVVLLQEPFGRPGATPQPPGPNGRPRCFCAVFSAGAGGLLISFIPPIGNGPTGVVRLYPDDGHRRPSHRHREAHYDAGACLR
jgi:hypothetical protein